MSHHHARKHRPRWHDRVVSVDRSRGADGPSLPHWMEIHRETLNPLWQFSDTSSTRCAPTDHNTVLHFRLYLQDVQEEGDLLEMEELLPASGK